MDKFIHQENCFFQASVGERAKRSTVNLLMNE